MISKIVSLALVYQASADERVDSRMIASGYASLIGFHHPEAGQSTAATKSPKSSSHGTWSPSTALPEGDVLRTTEDLEHVVAGPAEQLLERELQRMGTSPAQAGSHDTQRHRLPLDRASREGDTTFARPQTLRLAAGTDPRGRPGPADPAPTRRCRPGLQSGPTGSDIEVWAKEERAKRRRHDRYRPPTAGLLGDPRGDGPAMGLAGRLRHRRRLVVAVDRRGLRLGSPRRRRLPVALRRAPRRRHPALGDDRPARGHERRELPLGRLVAQAPGPRRADAGSAGRLRALDGRGRLRRRLGIDVRHRVRGRRRRDRPQQRFRDLARRAGLERGRRRSAARSRSNSISRPRSSRWASRTKSRCSASAASRSSRACSCSPGAPQKRPRRSCANGASTSSRWSRTRATSSESSTTPESSSSSALPSTRCSGTNAG